MIVKILADFADKNNFALKYTKGEVCEISDLRAEELISKGLVEPQGDLGDDDLELLKEHVVQKSKELEDLKIRLEAREEDLEKREIELADKERQFNTREAKLAEREKALQDKENAPGTTETKGDGEDPFGSYDKATLIDKLNAIGVTTPKNIGEAKLSEKIAALGEEEAAKLEEALKTA